MIFRAKILFFCFLMLLLSAQSQAQKLSTIRFSDLENRIKNADNILVINFWATWCKPCVEEIGYFDTIANELRLNNVKVLLVSLDFVKDTSKVEKFILSKKIQSEVLLLNELDYNSWINKIDKDWSGAIPATLLINKTKRKRLFFEKQFDYQTLSKTIQSIL